MRKPILPLTICAALAMSIAAAQAQHLYVPLTSYPGDGTILELVATNPDTQPRSFSGTILAEGSDGGVDPGTPTESIEIAPGSTRIVNAPPGIGLWRLQGFAGLQISARMRVATASPNHEGAPMPVLSTETVHAAGTTVLVQSLIAVEGYLSDVGLFNAGEDGARCEAEVVLSNGIQVGPTFALHVPPLSFMLFENVPPPAPAGLVAMDVHVAMSCDQDFAILSRTINPQTGYLAIRTGSIAMADGLPTPGSNTPPPPPPPPPPGTPPPPPPPPDNPPPPAGQTVRFSRNGQFFTPTAGNPAMIMSMPLPADVIYSQLTISFDVRHGGWYRQQIDGIHNLLYMTRGGWSGDVFALITARGPNRNLVRNEITVDLPKQQISQKQVNANLQPGTTYHVEYSYNHKNGRKWEVRITAAGGGVVANFSGPTTGPIWTKGGGWRIFLSDVPVAAHVTNIGWQYSDLEVVLTP